MEVLKVQTKFLAFPKKTRKIKNKEAKIISNEIHKMKFVNKLSEEKKFHISFTIRIVL